MATKAFRAPKNENLKCPECRPKRTYAEKRGLKKHIKRDHPHLNEKEVMANLEDICPFCHEVIKSVHIHKKKCGKNPAKAIKRHPKQKPSKMEEKGKDTDLEESKTPPKEKEKVETSSIKVN